MSERWIIQQQAVHLFRQLLWRTSAMSEMFIWHKCQSFCLSEFQLITFCFLYISSVVVYNASIYSNRCSLLAALSIRKLVLLKLNKATAKQLGLTLASLFQRFILGFRKTYCKLSVKFRTYVLNLITTELLQAQARWLFPTKLAVKHFYDYFFLDLTFMGFYYSVLYKISAILELPKLNEEEK